MNSLWRSYGRATRESPAWLSFLISSAAGGIILGGLFVLGNGLGSWPVIPIVAVACWVGTMAYYRIVSGHPLTEPPQGTDPLVAKVFRKRPDE